MSSYWLAQCPPFYYADLKPVLQGRDHTIYALTEGYVKFAYNKFTKRRSISVQLLPQQQQQQQQHEQKALQQVRLQLP